MSLPSSPAILWCVCVLFLIAGRLGLGTDKLVWPQPSRYKIGVRFKFMFVNACSRSALVRGHRVWPLCAARRAWSARRTADQSLSSAPCSPWRFPRGTQLPPRHIVPLGHALCLMSWAVPPSSCPRYRRASLPPLPFPSYHRVGPARSLAIATPSAAPALATPSSGSSSATAVSTTLPLSALGH
jgi:hypothetical protein